MKLRPFALALVLLFSSAWSFASDEVKVEILRFSSGGCDGTTTTLHFDSGAPINLTVGACDKRIDIWVPDQPFTYDIGPVTLNGNGGLFLELFIGAGSFPYGGGSMTPAARNLAGISIVEDTLRANTRFAGRIYGNLTGSVRVGELYRFDVDGQVKAQIRANEAGPALFDIHIGSSTAGGVILCDAGPMAGVVSQGDVLGRIEATTGGISSIAVLNSADLLADVIAGGSITAIEVTGDIGTSGDLVAIEAVDGIRKIVGSSLYADIDAGDGGADDALWYLETTSGDFVGSLECRDINSTETPSGLDIGGDLNADLRITRNVNEPLLAGGALVAGRRVKIGKLLNPGGSITLAAGGLRGEIILNTNADPAGDWLGNVTVGSTTLSPKPFYTQTGLGGGAVGLGPFNYHPVDSEPDDDSIVSDPDSITTATVWYYGPLFMSGTGDGPYKIESRVLKPPSQTWTDVSSEYTITIVGGVSRQVQITRNNGDFPVNREYRFVPYQSGSVKLLKCGQINGTPPVHDTSQDDHYSFSIPLGTIGTLDFSGDGKIDNADMTLWLMQKTDLDKDGTIDESDHTALQHVIDHGF